MGYKYNRTNRILQSNFVKLIPAVQVDYFHITASSCAWGKNSEPLKWLNKNKLIHPPQEPHEERRPAYVCHQKINIKYSPWKLWYIACLVRGMSVDEAIKQLTYVLKKGAIDVRKTIEEAKDLAVSRHNVEYASNLWVAESFVGKGTVFKGMRRHGRMRYGTVEYYHCHYFVRLEEGAPPKNYYQHAPKQPSEQLNDWLETMRKRKIISSL